MLYNKFFLLFFKINKIDFYYLLLNKKTNMAKPCRNSINVFDGQINFDILSDRLKNFIISNKIIFKDNFNYFLQSTSKHFGIFTDDFELIKLKNIEELKYLKINDEILKNYRLEEVYKDIKLLRSFTSFHQNCEFNRKIIWDVIFKNIHDSFTQFLLVGGECYFFGQFIQYKIKNPYIESYSENKSICNDFLFNTKIKSCLIKFTDIKFSHKEYDMTIFNVSKNGLKGNIVNEFMKVKSKIVIYIDCNIKKFKKDYEILSKKYNKTNSIKLHTKEKGYDFTLFIHILTLRPC